MPPKTRLFVILTGEHPHLPFAELRGILEACGLSASAELAAPQVAIVDASDAELTVTSIVDRAAYSRYVAKLIYFGSTANLPERLGDLIKDVEWPEISGSFKVMAVRIGGSSKEISGTQLEAAMGGEILKISPNLRVDLMNPEHIVLVALSGGKVFVGLLMGTIDRSKFLSREIPRRPFSHPASMRPKLARAMVNLGRVRPGDVMLDPFVGAGGIALEALEVGAFVLGCDIDEKIVWGAEQNLTYYGFKESFRLWVCDALNLGLEGTVDSIVTDPPYGRASSSRRVDPKKLIFRFLEKSLDLLKPGGYLTMAAPREFGVDDFVERVGYELVEVVDYREHKRLTRRIVVARLR